jgi:sigma-E factor negative regulatory protein RseB
MGKPGILARAALIGLGWLASGAHAADNPRAWLDRMRNAVEFLNYEGTMVHVNDADTSVLRILHRARNGEVTERITSSDLGREIIRTNEEVICILTDQGKVLVEPRDERSRQQSPLRANLPAARSVNSALYQVAFAGVENVAGRRTQVIAIRPKDSFRYGYRVAIDRANSMPLKTQLLDEEGRLLEQILFTEIAFQKDIADAELKPSIRLDSLATFRAPSARRLEETGAVSDGWNAQDLPPGFRMTVARARPAPNLPDGVRHVVYSDGLATVSLFIEPAVAASEQAEGLSRIGAANAYSTTVDGVMITAIGEVPARTVELFARGTRLAGGR